MTTPARRPKVSRGMGEQAQETFEPLVEWTVIARMLGVSKNWLYDQCKRGDIPHYQLGGRGSFYRFKVSEVEHWAQGNRRGGIDTEVDT